MFWGGILYFESFFRKNKFHDFSRFFGGQNLVIFHRVQAKNNYFQRLVQKLGQTFTDRAEILTPENVGTEEYFLKFSAS